MATRKAKQEKGGKPRKDIPSQSKQEKKLDAKVAKVNSDYWELKLKRTEQDLRSYKKLYYNMASENERLRSLLYQAEQCNFETTDNWQKEIRDKDKIIKSQEEQLRRQEERAIEWENKKKQYFEIFEERNLKRKATEASMRKKVCNMRKQMHISKEEYRENLRKKEKEMYSLLEKQRAEKEINYDCKEKEINQLKLYHEKAIIKLENELKNISKERDRLSENLKNALTEVEHLKKMSQSLSKDKLLLTVDKKILTSTLKENITEMALQEKRLASVSAQAASLKQALENLKEETKEKDKRNQVTIQASKVEVDKLQRIIAMREKEINHVKQLSRTIIEKRKDMEVFFYEALDHVRQEIADNRKRSKKEAYQDYHQKFREGTAGRVALPPIRTSLQSPSSTNFIYSDMKAAEKWPHPPSKEVYMSDLTWEQKEKVLTLLFAKMNGNIESVVNKKMDL